MLYWEFILTKNDLFFKEEQEGVNPYISDRLTVEARDKDYCVAAGKFRKAVKALGFDPKHDTIEVRLRVWGVGEEHDYESLSLWATWCSRSNGNFHTLSQADLESLGAVPSKEAE